MQSEGLFLLINQCSNTFRGKDLAGYLLQVLRRKVVDVTHDVTEVAFLTLMQEVLGEVEGELLATVAGNSQLTLQLQLGLEQLGGSERMLNKPVEFTLH